jgi:hypothetical protein
MSGKVDKRLRKEARKLANQRFMAMIRQIGLLPFRQRLRFAWRIVKGAK